MSDVKSVIESGRAVLGIEFGSTRIKAVLIGEDHAPIATGAHDWENMHLDIQPGYDLGGHFRLLQQNGAGCKGKVWCYHQKACGNRYFRHDARLSAF